MTSPKVSGGWPARLPLLIALSAMGFAGIYAFCVRMSEPLALSPWESGIAMEGIRMGIPVYDPSHATHLYGVLLTAALAGMFRITGLNLLAARIFFCGISVALMAVLAGTFGGRNLFRFGVILLMGLAVGWRTNFIIFTTQPDAAAALLGLLALICWARARSAPVMGLSMLLFITAMLFKQTAAALAVVPAVYAVMFERPVLARRLVIALLPLAAVVLTLAAIYAMAPAMFNGMVVVPALLKIQTLRLLPTVLNFFGSFPIIVLVVPSLLFGRPLSACERWAVAALVILFPACIWTVIKSGGSTNSMLPVYLALIGLVGSRLDDLLLRSPTTTAARAFAASSVIGAVLLGSFFFRFPQSLPVLFSQCGDDKYMEAVRVAQLLGPGVICPQDPTIPYHANGTFGRSLFFELDTHPVQGEWPPELPSGMAADMQAAHFLIQAECFVPAPQFDQALDRFGFHPLSVPVLAGSAYRVWRK
jgi:hypothetical protein